MMQQQICQPEQQMGQQQQQVMLCPVRLVYETQILVQPGEQIQPNQTLFINPQNPPPWIQNRAQNQVIYMQQMPNMVPSVPQQMDQQMYLQNLQNLQNYYPQQMIQVDQRQMPNVVQMMPNINNINQIAGQNVNMGQNVLSVGQNVSNIGQNVSNIGQNVSNIGQNVSINTGQNVMPMANVVQNINQKPANVGVNTVNIAQTVNNDRVYTSTNIMPNIPMASHQNTISNVTHMQERQINMNQNLVNMQKVAELQGLRPQNVRQPQVTVSPMQNVKFAPNVGDIRPTASPNVGPQTLNTVNSPRQMNVPAINNIPNNVVQANLLNKKMPLPNKPNSTVMANQVRHYNQTYYRHIQPKPMSVMPMQNQYLPMGTQTLAVPNQIINDVNRKRKSESPDDTRKKIPNINQTITLPTVANQTMSIVPTIHNKIVSIQTDIGVNTSPTREIKKGTMSPVQKPRSIQTASTGTQANIAKEKPQVIEMKVLPPLVKDNVQNESDKLVRNTVFTQARGLLRTEPQIMQPDVISIEKIETVVNPINKLEIVSQEMKVKAEEAVKIETKVNIEPMSIEAPKPITERMKTETKATEPVKMEISKPTELIKIEPNAIKPLKRETSTGAENKTKPIVKQEVQAKKEEKPVKVPKPELKLEKSPEATKLEVKEVKPVKTELKEVKPVKTEVKEIKEVDKKFKVTAISDLKGSELHITDGSVSKEDTDSYILTHVLDGYVIQESNTAFPIRRPLKEKTMYQNTDPSDQKKEETPYKHRTEDGKLIKDNSKILTISDLNLNEEDTIKSEAKTEEICDETDEDQPFSNLKPSDIKSWTVDQLAAHLSKYKWTETISVLAEHEIDGESLFLVSKPQLVHIGVSETHAEVICEFIKNT